MTSGINDQAFLSSSSRRSKERTDMNPGPILMRTAGDRCLLGSDTTGTVREKPPKGGL